MIQMNTAGYSENSKQIVATRALAKKDSDVHDFHHIGRLLLRSKKERNQFTKKTKSNRFRATGATMILNC